MSLLQTKFGYRILDAAKPRSWIVYVAHLGTDAGVLFGFARQRDAEMAMAALLKTSIDWSGSVPEINAQIDQFGGHDKLREYALEHLQW
jgi:hypothetical protein